jgi:N-acyl-D-amino-acid deacylase
VGVKARILLLVAALWWLSGTLHGQEILFKNIVIYDGTGKASMRGDVRIQGDRILEVGKKLTPKAGETVRDEHGLALAPGFIDMHSHADGEILEDLDAENSTRQGITTVVVGQDGESKYPLADFLGKLEKTPPALNVASMVGHGTVRHLAMDPKNQLREATPEELAKMKSLLSEELKAGPFGLSSGLEYDPGHFASTAEVIELSKMAGEAGGFYISHVRDEGNHVFDSYEEIIQIGKGGDLPVEITHIKMGVPAVWNMAAKRMPQVFEEARTAGVDLKADVYPYTFWQSNLRVIMLDRDYYNPEKVAKALEESGGANHMWFTSYKPDAAVVGKSLEEVAKMWKMSPVETYMKMVRASDAGVGGDPENEPSIMAESMSEADVKWLVAQPNIMFCSDGGLRDRHPRGAGSFPRVLGKYVRDEKALTLELAIHKMTEMPAQQLGLKDRGRIAAGYVADLVVFDPATVADGSTMQTPQAPPRGIAAVIVSGVTVVENNTATGAHPGKVLRRRAAQ